MISLDVPGSGWVHFDVSGTCLFTGMIALAIPFRDYRSVQIVVAVVSMVLFAIGAATTLWAYVSALERSRVDEIGVANLFFLTGSTATKFVKRLLAFLLAVQVVVAITGASVGAAGLSKDRLNALAFGILVPMFGIGMNGCWAVRYGSFGPRRDPGVHPSDESID